MRTLLTNCCVLRNAYAEVKKEDILIEDSKIAGFYEPGTYAERVFKRDLGGKLVIPGMVQTHVHLCQVLFRGLADDLPLLDWLKYKIWPMEAAHDDESMYLSALLGSMELVAGGVTTVCDMGSVRYAGQDAQALLDTGLRATFGKLLMDYDEAPDELGGMPKAFFETTDEALRTSYRLLEDWNGADNDRIRYAFLPRGILTTTEDLLRELGPISERTGCLVHTHACETEPESLLVKEKRGLTEIKYLESLGLASEQLLLAHCQYVDDEDIRILKESGIGVASCPATNLKLGSGIAPLERMRREGVRLSIGSDGAPCNNNLDMFMEMRYASLLQKGILHEPTAMNAADTFHIATQGGADVLGIGAQTGALAAGKKADLVVVDLDDYGAAPVIRSVSTLVYAGNRHMVTDVMIDGKWVFEDRRFPEIDVRQVRKDAEAARERVVARLL